MIIKNTLNILLAIILVGTLVSAGLGISFPYGISLTPGNSTEEFFSITNNGASEDSIIEITIEEGEEYIQFPNGLTISLSVNETERVKSIISLPITANEDKYPVKLLFKLNSSQTQNGTVSLIQGIGKSFDITVIKEEKKSNLTTIIGVILSITITAVIIIMFRMLRKKKN